MSTGQAQSVDGRTRRGQERRGTILAATCRLVVRDGLDGIRSATVASEAATSVGLIHYHFPTLDDLVLAAYLWDEQRVWDPIGQLDPAAEPLAVLDVLLAGQLSGSEADVRAGFMLWQEYARRAVFDEAIREVVVRRIERWVAVMADLIRAAAAKGEFAQDEAADDNAVLLAASLFGASVLHLIGLVPLPRAAADMSEFLTGCAAAEHGAQFMHPSMTELPMTVVDEATPAEAILDATLALIARGGVRTLHFADVGEQAGVSTALPRYYFTTMDALLAATFDRFIEQRRARATWRAAQLEDPVERIRDAIVSKVAMAPGERHDALVIWHEYLRFAYVHDEHRAAACTAVQADIDHVARLIADAQQVGAVPAEIDPAAAGRRLIEALYGFGLGGLLGIVGEAEYVRVLDWLITAELRFTV